MKKTTKLYGEMARHIKEMTILEIITFLREIDESADRMANIIDELRKFSGEGKRTGP